MTVYDSLAAHIDAAGSIDRAAVPPGLYLAWCVNLGLESRELDETAGRSLLRVRYREMKGSELLVAACAGRLETCHLGDAGRRFTASYYPGYLDEFAATFGGSAYDVPDDWDSYDRIARVLTARYLGGTSARRAARWWQIWK